LPVRVQLLSVTVSRHTPRRRPRRRSRGRVAREHAVVQRALIRPAASAEARVAGQVQLLSVPPYAPPPRPKPIARQGAVLSSVQSSAPPPATRPSCPSGCSSSNAHSAAPPPHRAEFACQGAVVERAPLRPAAIARRPSCRSGCSCSACPRTPRRPGQASCPSRVQFARQGAVVQPCPDMPPRPPRGRVGRQSAVGQHPTQLAPRPPPHHSMRKSCAASSARVCPLVSGKPAQHRVGPTYTQRIAPSPLFVVPGLGCPAMTVTNGPFTLRPSPPSQSPPGWSSGESRPMPCPRGVGPVGDDDFVPGGSSIHRLLNGRRRRGPHRVGGQRESGCGGPRNESPPRPSAPTPQRVTPRDSAQASRALNRESGGWDCCPWLKPQGVDFMAFDGGVRIVRRADTGQQFGRGAVVGQPPGSSLPGLWVASSRVAAAIPPPG